MRRFLALLLVLVLSPLLMAVAELPVENRPDEYVGLWSVFVPSDFMFDLGSYSFVLILNSDGTMACVASFDRSESGSVTLKTTTGKWFFASDMIFYQSDGKETYGYFTVRDGMIWITVEDMSFGMKKIQTMDATQFFKEAL